MSVNKVNQSTGELSPISGGTLYADAPVGSIQAYGGSSAPWGWLLCQGQAISRATYAELFNVIGTSFGEGDGSTTFNVPDLRESVPVGTGTRDSGVTTHDTYDIGQFKDDQLQNHTHSITSNVSARGLTNRAPVSNAAGWTFFWGNDNTNDNTGRTGTTTHGKQLGVNYIIKATTIALPSDFASAVDDKISANMVDSITDGNMKAATSNAVYDALHNATWSTIDGWTRTKLDSGLIFAYRRIQHTCGTTKGSANSLHPNSYYSIQSFDISNLGFVRDVMAKADVLASYPANLKSEALVDWNNKNVHVPFWSDNNTGTWDGRVVLIGF